MRSQKLDIRISKRWLTVYHVFSHNRRHKFETFFLDSNSIFKYPSSTAPTQTPGMRREKFRSSVRHLQFVWIREFITERPVLRQRIFDVPHIFSPYFSTLAFSRVLPKTRVNYLQKEHVVSTKLHPACLPYCEGWRRRDRRSAKRFTSECLPKNIT